MARSDRQAARTARQTSRQTGRTDRASQRSTKQGVRQSKRAERQKTRQEQKSQRVMARQTTKAVKHQAKGDSGYWSPEGQQAKWEGIQGTVGAGTEAAGRIAAGIMTGGASEAAGGILGGLGGAFGNGMEGGTYPTANGGMAQQEVFTGEIVPMGTTTEWYQDPKIIIPAALLGAGGVWFATRKKK